MTRMLTIHETVIPRQHAGQTDRRVASLRLQGKWLREAGFEPGSKVKIEFLDGPLVASNALIVTYKRAPFVYQD